MTGPVCGCGSPVRDAFLCRDCVKHLRATLILAAAIAADLQDAVARQLTRGQSARQPGKPEPPLPYDPYAAIARGRLLGLLQAWCREITGRDASTVAGAAITLYGALSAFRQHPDAWQASMAITAAVREAERVIDRPPERVYAGPCPQCGADVLGTQGSAIVKCTVCGAEHEVEERQDAMRMAFQDLLFTVPRCLTMMAATGHPISEFTMRSWIRRKQLVNHGYQPSPNGREPSPLYRLGDVMKLEEQNPRRRPRETSALVALVVLAQHTGGRIAESGSRDAP